MHAFPSLHGVPSAELGVEQTPVLGLHVPAVWHAVGEGHESAVPPQTPAWHLSFKVQALPSLHVVPFVAFGLEQRPVVVLHVPAVWQESEAVHTTGLAPVHTPDWHVSTWVQAFPSLQGVPFGVEGLEQEPLTVSQVPARWHWSEAVHTFAAPDWHTPDWHVSPLVQALPSEQVVPEGAFGLEQVPEVGSQVPGTWH